MTQQPQDGNAFHLLEATIDDVERVYASGDLSAREITQLYLNRIDAYDKKGPKLNAVIQINPKALEVARALDQ